jgi:putative RNA 2'-phosphotransferase
VLRHRPDSIGIQLDSNGWTDVDCLLDALKESGVTITRKELTQIVNENDKQRFAFSKDFTEIRASQGHSVPVDLKLKAQLPPVTLYHGTSIDSIDKIRKEGLKPMTRNHVHLSKDPQTALQVGTRHGKAVVLEVNAEKMNSAGYKFYLSENKVWLTDVVPTKFITFPKQS